MLSDDMRQHPPTCLWTLSLTYYGFSTPPPYYVQGLYRMQRPVLRLLYFLSQHTLIGAARREAWLRQGTVLPGLFRGDYLFAYTEYIITIECCPQEKDEYFDAEFQRSMRLLTDGKLEEARFIPPGSKHEPWGAQSNLHPNVSLCEVITFRSRLRPSWGILESVCPVDTSPRIPRIPGIGMRTQGFRLENHSMQNRIGGWQRQALRTCSLDCTSQSTQGC